MSKTMSILGRLVRLYEWIFIAVIPNDGLIRVHDRDRYLLSLREDGEPRRLRITCQCNGVSNVLSVFSDEESYLAAIGKFYGGKKIEAIFFFYPQQNNETEAHIMGYCSKCGSSLAATIIVWRNME